MWHNRMYSLDYEPVSSLELQGFLSSGGVTSSKVGVSSSSPWASTVLNKGRPESPAWSIR